MHIVPFNSIYVSDRQRKSIRPLEVEQLAESIIRNGLIHAPVVEPIDPSSDEAADGEPIVYRLIAGERRLRAIGLIHAAPSGFIYDNEPIDPGEVPVTFRSELTEIQRQEIELEENILRSELSWQDRAAAIAGLHALRQSQDPTQTLRDTAVELVKLQPDNEVANVSEVSRAVQVAKRLSDPRVSGARNLKEALNVINRDFEEEIRKDLIQATGQSSDHIILEGSCIELLPQLQDEMFDCICTDIPYGMGADSFGDVGPQHSYRDDHETMWTIANAIFTEGWRLCRSSAHLYMFCDIQKFYTLVGLAKECGWQVFRTPIIWHKTSSMGHDPIPQKGFRRSYETILYAMKGDKPYNVAMSDVISVPNISSPYHPAAKPVELIKKLLERSCIPGDHVLDPTCGVGTIFEAANALKLQATGIEIDPQYATIASNKRFEVGK